jgi:hypothetical protein
LIAMTRRAPRQRILCAEISRLCWDGGTLRKRWIQRGASEEEKF